MSMAKILLMLTLVLVRVLRLMLEGPGTQSNRNNHNAITDMLPHHSPAIATARAH